MRKYLYIALITVLFLPDVNVIAADSQTLDEYATRKQIQTYSKKVLIPFLSEHPEILKACQQANKDRTEWAPYTEQWKEMSAADYPKTKEGYTKSEYRWTIVKDKNFRRSHMQGAIGKVLKEFQKKEKAITEIFITDKVGGNIVQTTETTDWFQGDEKKFMVPAKTKTLYVSPMEEDSSAKGKKGSHVSLPLLDNDELVGIAIFFVNPESLPKEDSL